MCRCFTWWLRKRSCSVNWKLWKTKRGGTFMRWQLHPFNWNSARNIINLHVWWQSLTNFWCSRLVIIRIVLPGRNWQMVDMRLVSFREIQKLSQETLSKCKFGVLKRDSLQKEAFFTFPQRTSVHFRFKKSNWLHYTFLLSHCSQIGHCSHISHDYPTDKEHNLKISHLLPNCQCVFLRKWSFENTIWSNVPSFSYHQMPANFWFLSFGTDRKSFATHD